MPSIAVPSILACILASPPAGYVTYKVGRSPDGFGKMRWYRVFADRELGGSIVHSSGTMLSLLLLWPLTSFQPHTSERNDFQPVLDSRPSRYTIHQLLGGTADCRERVIRGAATQFLQGNRRNRSLVGGILSLTQGPRCSPRYSNGISSIMGSPIRSESNLK